jgi:glycerophosphoryl diester phosphodiesterase
MNVLLDPGARLVIAHRGDSAHVPENTLESFQQGLALGADALEFDVRATRDGKAVVMHDATLERTTNGTGPVAAMTLDQLQRLDAGWRFTRDGGRTFPFRGRGITIPSLEHVLGTFPHAAIIVEIKTPAASAEVRRLLMAARAEGRCLVGAFADAAIAPFRGSGLAHCASRRELVRLYARAWLPGGPRRLSYAAVVMPPSVRHIRLPVLRFARMARGAGICTHVWTVDHPAQARRYWTGGVNGIITNDPGAMVALAGRAIIAPSTGTLSPVA